MDIPIPQGWTESTLADFALVNMGQSPKGVYVNEIGDGVPFYQGKAEFGKSHPTPKKACTKPTKIVEEGDILLSVRAPVGPTNVCQETSCIGRGLAGIRSNNPESQPFLLYYFKYIEPWLSQQGTGTTFKAVSGSFLKDLTIPTPPLEEQIRIANKLDELLAQVDTIKARVDAIPGILKRFRQSVLAAAVSGKLTEDWRQRNPNSWCHYSELFEANNNRKCEELSAEELEAASILSADGQLPGFWKHFPLEQLVDVDRGIPYGIVQTGEYFDGGVPAIRCGDVKPLVLDDSQLKLVDPKISENYKRTLLQGGEVLLAIRGTVGNAAVVQSELAGCNISREVALIPVGKQMDSNFVAILLQSPIGFRRLAQKVRGVAQKGINLADVRRFVTPVPPLEEQLEIVRKVKGLFLLADQLEQAVSAGQSRITNISQAILAKAFRGELVRQYVDNQPAEIQLNRIQSKL